MVIAALAFVTLITAGIGLFLSVPMLLATLVGTLVVMGGVFAVSILVFGII